MMYLGASLLTFAFSHNVQKVGIQAGVSPGVFSLTTVFFSAVFVGVIWLALQKKNSLSIRRQDIKNLAAIGMGHEGLLMLLSISALSFTTATNKGVMQGLYTASTALIAYYWLKERLPRLYYPMLVLIVAGIVLLTSNGMLSLPNKGDWLLFMTVPLVGFGNVFAKRTMKEVHPLTVSLGRFVFALPVLVIALCIVGIDQIDSLQNGLVWVGLSGLLRAVVVIAFYKAVELEGATIPTTILSISPVITAFADFLWLEVVFSSLQILGLSFAVVGAVAVTTMKARYQK